MRKGKEFYSGLYKQVMDMHGKGIPAREISRKTGISYSSVYAWTRKGRKPGQGSLNEFAAYLKKNGPMPLLKVREKFSKHSEIYLSARHRKLPVKRAYFDPRLDGYSMWYLLEGQEKDLEKRIERVLKKRNELKKMLFSSCEITKT